MYDSIPGRDHSPSAPLHVGTRARPIAIGTANLVLKSLPSAVHGELSGQLRTVEVGKDENLLYQGEELEFVLFPETAVLSEFRVLDDGRMVEVAMIGREGVAGLSSLFSGAGVGNSVQVSQAGKVTRVGAGALRALGRRYPELPLLFHSQLEKQIRSLSQRSLCNMFHSLEERFCTWLLMFEERSDRKIMKLTHEQIARTLGVYRPSLTCVALSMREKALIDYSRGGISIRDRRRVEGLACGCYTESQMVAASYL
jgi:CRP-like cAMP-binding protein